MVLFVKMLWSYGRMSPQQKNNQQSSVFDMLYAFDWHYLYMSLSWKDGRRSIFQSIFMFLISTLTPWHKTQFSENLNFPCFRLRHKHFFVNNQSIYLSQTDMQTYSIENMKYPENMYTCTPRYFFKSKLRFCSKNNS